MGEPVKMRVAVTSPFKERAQLLVQGDNASNPFFQGAADCLKSLDEIKSSPRDSDLFDSFSRGEIPETFVSRQNSEYRLGFTAICRRIDDFFRTSLTESELAQSTDRILQGYALAASILKQAGIDPVEAQKSTLENPKVYVTAESKEGSGLKTLNVYTIIPSTLAEAERLLVSEMSQLGVRTQLMSDEVTLVEGQPNAGGKPFTVNVGLVLPVISERKLNLVITATRTATGFVITQKYSDGKGNVKTFDGVVTIWSLGPDRFLLSYKLFVDLNTYVPDFVINWIQEGLFLDFVREILSHVKK